MALGRNLFKSLLRGSSPYSPIPRKQVLADVGADRECLQIVDCRAAVIALVGDDFLDHYHRIIG
jgi:hypothetical protein